MRNLMSVLRDLMIPDEAGHQGLAKIIGAKRIVVKGVSLIALIRAMRTGEPLSGMEADPADIIPSPVSVIPAANGLYDIELMVRPGLEAPDPARWTSLSRRLQGSSRCLGVVTVLVADYRADGHGFIWTDRARLLDVTEDLFQATGYVLGEEGQEPILDYRHPVIKGMVKVGIDHPDLDPHHEALKDVDLVVNGNMIKGGSFPVGTRLQVALYEQAKAGESDQIIDLTLPWQVLVRASDLLTEEAWSLIESDIRSRFGKEIELLRGLTEENPFQTSLSRMYQLGLIPVQSDLKRQFINRAKSTYKVRVPGFLLKLLDDPRVERGCISLPRRFRRWMAVGDKVTCFRLPFLGHEVETLTVSDFRGLGVRDASLFAGDTDGDPLFVCLGTLVDQARVDARREHLKSVCPVLESNRDAKGLTGYTASLRALVSKSQIGLRDAQITDAAFRSKGGFSNEWARLIGHAQDAVDFIKKDIPDIQLIGRIERGAPAIYKTLNGKAASLEAWIQGLLDGRKRHGHIGGPLGRLIDMAGESIPTPVFRTKDTPFDTEFYPFGGMPIWEKLLRTASPGFLAKVRGIVARYRPAAKLLSEHKVDEAMAQLRQLEEELNVDPRGSHVADFIAMNILCGDPLRLIKSAKILVYLPVSPDMIRYYNWQRRFSPDYGYRRVRWEPKKR